jgi:ABC-2 type transport system permease protein
MKPYLSYLRARFRMMLQYRLAAFAGVVTQVFWGFIKIMILEAFYSHTAVVQPITFDQAVVYVWLGQAFFALLPWNIDPQIQRMVNTGSVSYELIRPLDLYTIWYFRNVAWRSGAILLRCIPLIAFAAGILPLTGLADIALRAPPDISSFILWLVSMTLALALSCAITTLLHVSMMWTISGKGVAVVVPAAVWIFSGMIIPLPLFPDKLQLFFKMLPFHGLVDTPLRIYSGNIEASEALVALLIQAVWIFALIAAGKVLARRGFGKIAIQGG